MNITQNSVLDSLDLTFSGKPAGSAPDVRIKKGETGQAVVEINGMAIDPSSHTKNPITWFSLEKTYSKNDLVVVSGEVYRSLIDNNRGNNPETDSTTWIRLEHVIEYRDYLPKATENSVLFIEVNKQLYYKTIDKGIYQYKQISSGSSPSGGIKNVYVDNVSVVQGEDAIITLPVKQYNAVIPYATNDLVVCEGHIFRSAIDNNKGNNPLISAKQWKEITKDYEHVDLLPSATSDSPSIIEMNGDLYYKITRSGSTYVNYEYKKVEKGGSSDLSSCIQYWDRNKTYALDDYVCHSGHIYRSKENGNLYNTPLNFGDCEHWELITLSFKKVTKEESEALGFLFDRGILYEIVDEQTYHEKEKLDFQSDASKAGWTVNEFGITNAGMHIAWTFEEIPDHWSTVHELLERRNDGPLSMAYDKNNNMVFKYQEDWEDECNTSLVFYDDENDVLSQVYDSKCKLYNPLEIKVNETYYPYPDNTDIEIYKLSHSQIVLAATYIINSVQPVYLLDKDNNIKYNIIHARKLPYENGYVISLDYWNNYNHYIVDYTAGYRTVSASVIDLMHRIINLEESEGMIRITEMTETTIIRYFDRSNNEYYDMHRAGSDEHNLIYRSDDYQCYVDKESGNFFISKRNDKILKIETQLLPWENSKHYFYPNLSYRQLNEIMDSMNDGNEIIIQAGDTTYHKVQSIYINAANQIVMQLGIFNTYLEDTTTITYIASEDNILVEMTPVHNLKFNTDDLFGELPDYIREIYLPHKEDFVVNYIEGAGGKLSALRYEYREDKMLYYTNRYFWCEINIETFEYTIGNF